MSEVSKLVLERFTDRLTGDLATNNTLRGAWVEEIVAWHLDVSEFPGQWNYFDLRFGAYTVSIKQSVGTAARFDVGGRRFAWDNALAKQRRAKHKKAEAWYESVGEPALIRWCDLYVFAHLPHDKPELVVNDIETWRFAACSRSWLDQHAAEAKSLSAREIERRGLVWLKGSELKTRLTEVCSEAEPIHPTLLGRLRPDRYADALPVGVTEHG